MSTEMQDSNGPPSASTTSEVDADEGMETDTTSDYLRPLSYIDSLAMFLRRNKEKFEPVIPERSPKIVIGHGMLKHRVGD